MDKLLNLEKLLSKNGLCIVSYGPYQVNIDFIDSSEVSSIVQKFYQSHKEADKLPIGPNKDDIYKSSWAMLEEAEKKYLPRLKPIQDALDGFYKNRNTPYRYFLFIEVEFLDSIKISPNEDTIKFFNDDNLLIEQIQKEFLEFNKFLENYI